MEKIFYPQSIAVVGLSSKPNNIPRLTLENMLRWGFKGRIFGIHPKSTEPFVDGVKMYKQVEDLPIAPDLVYALIPARAVPEMVERCGKKGVKRMAIPSGGFAEFGENGKKLADLTVATAKKYGIRFVGPNGLTVANTANGLCFPFAPLVKPPKGGISIISQSGGVGLMIINYLKDENLGMAKFASIGNKLDLDEVDFLEYFGTDPDTQIILMYLESISRGQELLKAAQQINKPIVIYKSNSTQAGKRAAMSHTAAISNDEEIVDSAFEKAGIIRIHDFNDFFAVAKAFQLPPMKGKKVMVMSPAGGFSVVMADLCEKAGFDFADPGEEFYKGLQQFTNAGVIKFSNPLDMGDIYDPQLVAHVICAVMHSPEVDGALYVSFTPEMPSGENIFRTLFRTDLSKEAWGAILSSGKPLGGCLTSPSLSRFKQAINVPIFNNPEEMVRAMSLQQRFYAHLKTRSALTNPPQSMDFQAVKNWIESHEGAIGEESYELLNCCQIPTIVSYDAKDLQAVKEIAKQISFPAVMKVISPDALHKSDVGGVILNIASATALEKAFFTIEKNLMAHKPDARFDGVRIQEMGQNGYDLFVGAKRDETFGPIVFFGLGGIHIEIMKDIANVVCPATYDEIRQRFEKLKAHQLIKGHRGEPTGDQDAFIDVVMRVSHLVHQCPQIKELDLNPVRVTEKGVITLDARILIE